ncbi:hypothetical protein [Erysipelothrix piscisicarius]
MPQWFIVSIDLETHPNFEDLDALTQNLLQKVPRAYALMHAYL